MIRASGKRRGEMSPFTAFCCHLGLWVVGVSMVVPFGWMLLTSFKSEGEVFQKHLLPRAVSLGSDGQALTTVDGKPLFTAERQKDAQGMPVVGADGKFAWKPAEPLRVRTGNPTMDGSKGDHARSKDGESLYDDHGVPVLNGMIQTDPAVIAAGGGLTRFRDPRQIAKYAEPVLVPREFLAPDNEAAAKRYFSRFSATWEDTVRERWGGRLPLMLTAAMKDAWQGRADSDAALEFQGVKLIDPGVTGRVAAYPFKEVGWNLIGEPVRYLRRGNTIVDGRGLPIRFQAPFPVYRTDDDPLAADPRGGKLLVRVGSPDATPGTILGRAVATTDRIRLVTGNYQTVLNDPEIKMTLFAWNSFFVCICTVALKLLTSSLAAFAFSRLEWPGRDRIFICYLATLMIPGVVTAIPNYLILQQLGWLNTFWALIIPGASTAYGTFMLRQYMLTLPKSLEEAARIDGASLLRVWWDIAVPMTKPALITLAIFTFAGTWQSFSWPLIVAPDESVRLLPVALQQFSEAQKTAYNLLMAGSVLLMIPTLLLFLVGQKYFVSGIQLGGVKG
ncbi:hypothetical protein LBMAG53_04140 [Planctomycetota bacterium]|nr:hypothetical protein LBMAG53_04140 [Planctomycetota bacterium]